MSQSDDTSGFKEFRPPADAPAQDVFDQALSEILSKDNAHAYTLLTTIQRTLQQYHLDAQFEAYEILHEAYLRGKKSSRPEKLFATPTPGSRPQPFTSSTNASASTGPAPPTPRSWRRSYPTVALT